jgi:hypothetical protein
MNNDLNTDTATATSAHGSTETKQKREKTWTAEKFRVYHRERYRKAHNVLPERQRIDDQGNRVSTSKYKTHEEFLVVCRERVRKCRPPVPKTECALCGEQYYDSDKSKLRHEKTRIHKLAVGVASRIATIQVS